MSDYFRRQWRFWPWLGVLSIAAAGLVWAQAQAPEALTWETLTALEPAERLAMGERILMGRPEADRALTKSEKAVVIGEIYRAGAESQDRERALAVLKGIAAQETDPELKALALKSLGNAHRERQEYAESRECFLQAIEIAPVRRMREDLRYQIADDDWSSGSNQAALAGFLDVLSNCPVEEKQRLILFVVFDVLPQLLEDCSKETPRDAVLAEFDNRVEQAMLSDGVCEPALMLAKSARYLYAGQPEDALTSIEAIEDEEWRPWVAMMEVSVRLRTGWPQKALEILDALVKDEALDNALTRYLAIEATNLAWAEEYERVAELANWWLDSTIWMVPNRLESVSKHVPPQLLFCLGASSLSLQRSKSTFDALASGWNHCPDSRWGRYCGVLYGKLLAISGERETGEALIREIHAKAHRRGVRAYAANALIQVLSVHQEYDEIPSLVAESMGQDERDGHFADAVISKSRTRRLVGQL